MTENSEDLLLSSIKTIISMEPGDRSNYELIQRIGSGMYGVVFEAFNTTNNNRCAVKVLKSVKKEKVLLEISILKRVSDGPNIIKLLDVLISDYCLPALVFHFVSNSTLKDVMMDFSEYEIKYYLFNLLRALEFTHNQGIIHRDVKPSNVLVDRNRKLLRLIDWGLADLITNQESFSVCVASRYYIAPELLLGNKYYDFSLDMWSFGCILASVLFRRVPFFCGSNKLDQLKKIVFALGSKQLKIYAEKNLTVLSNSGILFVKNAILTEQKTWSRFIVDDKFKHSISDISLSLISSLLKYDQRSTALDAINHVFFDMVR